MNYQPPSFRKPQEFDIPGSIDGIFQQYQQMKDRQNQEGRQDFADTVQYGTPIRNLSPEQLQRGAMGPTVTPAVPQGPYPDNMVSLPTPARPEQVQFDNDPHVAAIQRFIQTKKQGAAQGVRKENADIGLTEAKTKNELAEAGKRNADAGNAGAAKGLKAEDDLRGELQTLSKPFVQVRDAMGRIEAAAKNPSAAGDLALIFNYMKVLDPGSTVREGEFATAQNSAGMPERIRAKYNQVVNGKRLEETQRADFVDRARDLYKSQENIQKNTEGQYRELASRRGANPQNVILDQGLRPQGGQTRESIRADFQAGKISREQAKTAIAALGGNNGRP